METYFCKHNIKPSILLAIILVLDIKIVLGCLHKEIRGAAKKNNGKNFTLYVKLGGRGSAKFGV